MTHALFSAARLAHIPPVIRDNVTLPVFGAPMLMPCHPPLTIAQCTSGIIGAFPALAARPSEVFEEWIVAIKAALEASRKANPGTKVAPFAVNQIVLKSNTRLETDLEICVKHQVPIVVTSLGARGDVVKAVHSYGGLVFHDVATIRHAEKALAQDVDGLVLLCAGAGGHGGHLNPFAFVSEVRRFYDGMLAVAGCITNGRGIAAMRALGADFGYIGTRFIATPESRAPQGHKQMITETSADDILYSEKINGILGNWLKPSLVRAGLDPNNLVLKAGGDEREGDITGDDVPKAWRDIWPAGQAVGDIKAITPVAEIVTRLRAEYEDALTVMAA